MILKQNLHYIWMSSTSSVLTSSSSIIWMKTTISSFYAQSFVFVSPLFLSGPVYIHTTVSFSLFYHVISVWTLSAHKYHNRYEFLADIERILENCILYNGKDSTYTHKAEKMVNVCRTTLEEVRFQNFLWIMLYFSILLHYHKSSLSDITPSYYATTFINSPRHVSASFIRPSSGWYFLSWSLLHLSTKPHVSCFVVHNELSGSP
jgi:hypothetical protein